MEMRETVASPSRPLPAAGSAKRAGGGRPTKAAAAARDERLLEIATRMFMEQGFDATSMDRLAEAAAIGKATLYGRYADKAALFAAVLRRRIFQIYAPLEEEFASAADATVDVTADLATILRGVARRLLAHAVSADTLALTRILSAQSGRFPELGRLAVREGSARQVGLVAAILARYAGHHRYRIADLDLAADLFLSVALGRVGKTALFGVPVDPEESGRRVDAAVAVFLGGLIAPA